MVLWLESTLELESALEFESKLESLLDSALDSWLEFGLDSLLEFEPVLEFIPPPCAEGVRGWVESRAESLAVCCAGATLSLSLVISEGERSS